MRKDDLELIHHKLIEAISEIQIEHCGNCGDVADGGYCSVLDSEGEGQPHHPNPAYTIERPIRLADLLLAIRRQPQFEKFSFAVILGTARVQQFLLSYDLTRDNIDAQSEQTISLAAAFF